MKGEDKLKEIISTLNLLIDEIVSFQSVNPYSKEKHDYCWERVKRWEQRVIKIFENNFSKTEAVRFREINATANLDDSSFMYNAHLRVKIAFIKSLRDDIKNDPDYWSTVVGGTEKSKNLDASTDTLDVIRNWCSRFNLVAKQLANRYDNRETLDINDENDVVDLLHALLKMDFKDIKIEEWQPKYAKKPSRVFLLKKQGLIIEAKKTGAGVGEKELRNQLLVDIERYRRRRGFKTLFCFVYDPDGFIQRPVKLEDDLSHSDGKFEVEVFVGPKMYLV